MAEELKPEQQTGSIIIPQQTEFIEVTKNTKGYNFAVKILSTDIDKLKTITDKLNIIYSDSNWREGK